MKTKMLLFACLLLTPLMAAYAGQKEDEQDVKVYVKTWGSSVANGVGEFVVYYYRSAQDLRGGCYPCEKYNAHYSIAPRRASVKKNGYFIVRSDSDISRDQGRRIYFEKGDTESDLMFPINIIPDKYSPDDPIEIEVEIAFTN